MPTSKADAKTQAAVKEMKKKLSKCYMQVEENPTAWNFRAISQKCPDFCDIPLENLVVQAV